MAIATKRFSAFDTETNIGTADYSSLGGSSIANLGINDDIKPTASIDELVNSAIEKNAAEEAAESALDKATRVAKGATSSFTDITKLTGSAKTDFLNSVSGGNAQVAKTLGTTLDKCSTNRGLGAGLNKRPGDMSANCGNGNVSLGRGGSSSSNCSASSFGDLLSKLTGGIFSGVFKDTDSIMRALMALAGQGYGLGMCGVFGSLSQSPMGSQLTNLELSQVSGGLLSTMGLSGNTNGFLDVANSSAGLTPLMSNPDGIQNFYSNFNLGGTKEYGMCTMSDRALAGGDLLSDDWRTSEDGLPSTGGFGDWNSDLSSCFEAKVADRSFGDDELDNYIEDDDAVTLAAYSTGDRDVFADMALDW